MDSRKTMVVVLAVTVVVISGLGFEGKWAAAQVHHVVGDDRGWDISSDISSWASSRTFIVGDFLWFAYASGRNKDNVVELKSIEEYQSCDLTNPIMMLTDGLDQIHLHQSGTRYFTSSNPDNCNKGLKLIVDVSPNNPTAQIHSSSPSLLAQQPVSPSSSTAICGPIFVVVVAVIFSHVAAYV